MNGNVPERQVQIGRNLRRFREYLQISRTAFALAIGIGSGRLASYESGRVPLRYEVFSMITKRFCLRPFFLVHGNTAPLDDLPFDDSEFFRQIDPKALFTEVYDSVLEPRLRTQNYQNQIKMRRLKWQVDDFIASIAPGRVLVPENPVSVADLASSLRMALDKVEACSSVAVPLV